MFLFNHFKDGSKLVRKRALHRLKIAWAYWTDRREKDPVFVLATRRSGSNLLMDCLESIPSASFAREILNDRMAYGIRCRCISRRTALRHIAYSINNLERRVCGAKLLAEQMDARRIVVGDILGIFPSARFVVLYRRSLLEQFVSLQIAKSTGVWRWVDGPFTPPDSLTIDGPEFARFCDRTRDFYDRVRKTLAPGKAIFVSYEGLAADTQGIFENLIFPFLGLNPVVVRSVTRKQNHRRPEDIVANYPQIEKAFDRGKWIQEYPVWYAAAPGGGVK